MEMLNPLWFFRFHQRQNCRRRNSKILGASPGKEPAALFISLRTPLGSSQNLLGARPQRQQTTWHRHERLPKNLWKAREGRNPSRIFNHTQQRVRVGRDDLRGGKSPFQNKNRRWAQKGACTCLRTPLDSSQNLLEGCKTTAATDDMASP